MAKKEAKSTAFGEINKDGFNLKAFKKSKNYDQGVGFKKQEWIKISDAFSNILSLPGIPKGHITLLRGHTDTGKTTAMLETAVAAQKQGILPVFIITEMKWSWDHAKDMGLEINYEVDEDTGEMNPDGFFIYRDRETLNTIEDVAFFIADLINEQGKGNIPYDFLFLWDSVGSIPCRMSYESNKNNNEWNAGAMSTQFGNFINQKIVASRKSTYPFTNTLVVVNKIWVQKPSLPMELPKMKNKGGETMAYDASIIVTFGNISNSGTSKLKAKKNGKEVEFAKRTKVAVEKNHITESTTKGRIILTSYGFIEDDKKQLDDFKKKYSDKWSSILGTDNFDIVEDNKEWEENSDFAGITDNDTE